MNYIKIINWFWDEVPFMDGCKSAHITLFFAILDAINKNSWASNTKISYDRLVNNKCHFGKPVYLESRRWLEDNGIIEYVPGKNLYQTAIFNLGVAVRNQTAIRTPIDEVADLNHTSTDTGDDTTIRPLSVPIIKQLNNKPLKPQTNNSTAELNIPFIDFWNLYDKKVGELKKIEKMWSKLTDEERSIAYEHIPKYKISQPDKKFRKDPKTYLYNKSFTDEIINSNGNSNGFIAKQSAGGKQAGFNLVADSFTRRISEV